MNYRPPIIIDLLDYASMVENRCGMLLKAFPAGLYLPTFAEPVITLDKVYYDQNGVVIDPNQMAGSRIDIYDDKGNQVLSARRAQLLKPEPYLPARGMRIIKAMVDFKIMASQAWSGKQFEQYYRNITPNYDVDEIAGFLDPFLAEQYRGNFDVYEYFEQILCSFDELLSEYLYGDEWVIHSVSYNSTHLTIKKEIDYRVDFYNRLHHSEHVVIAVGGPKRSALLETIATHAERFASSQFPEQHVETHLCRR